MSPKAWVCLLLVVTSTSASLPRPDMLFLDWSRRRMLSITSGSCQVMDDSDAISWMERRAPYGMVREIGSQELEYMVTACDVMRTPEHRPSLFIYPGTKWCGSGSLAFGYNDLGSLSAEDQCCRNHDYCPASLRAGQCRNGLCNPSTVTRSHCECDLQFRRCLQSVGSAASHALGALYFNIAKVPCFSEKPKPPQRRNARFGFSGPCEGPFCNYVSEERPTRYQYHRLSPYSAPFLGLSYPSFSSVVPTAISNVLFTVFKFIGVA